MGRGSIILLNGVSSSGKTTLARALADWLPGYFSIGLDDFDRLIERMEDREHGRLIPVETEVFFHQAIAMFSDAGVNLIVDHILHDRHTRQHIFAVLADYPVLFAGVHCPVEELERREEARGDRIIGQGRRQLAFVHQEMEYDVAVDTCAESIEGCCARIVDTLRGGAFPRGWLHSGAKLKEN